GIEDMGAHRATLPERYDLATRCTAPACLMFATLSHHGNAFLQHLDNEQAKPTGAHTRSARWLPIAG
ncbi:hypothetical protein, partial [Bradyrhizobium liaoningense]|uniref:hypothetical protein n=1 Tax=Bradyrhizobium liaoningense TaxID=43992 RepID=UPI001BA4D8AB